MNESTLFGWERFKTYFQHYEDLGLSLDISRMTFDPSYLLEMEPAIQKAFAEMKSLESGAIANKDENRMVGHYWLRNPKLAPTAEITAEIEQTLNSIKKFADDVHSGKIHGTKGTFKHLLVIGIGGSALGPQLVAQALGNPASDKMSVSFFDNTDPDGMDKTLASLLTALGQTLCVVISKSGGTKETRNGMLEAKAAFVRSGLNFANHAVAVTGVGSDLDKVAEKEGWMARFPMWDWVGGRTSELSAVGLLPAALQGVNVVDLLDGARLCDNQTRIPKTRDNPAATLALMWFWATRGKGEKAMVVLPYKDRLELFSKYLQQLVMESLGKSLDRDGKRVEQGISVYGNKGSTDQHAYVQQLRDGLNNFFATFIEVQKDRVGSSMEVDPGATSGDYLTGFYLGTREALSQNGRQSVTLTMQSLNAKSMGLLIALFERTVGFYASLINVNAYHQPGVEAGKKAATAVLSLQGKISEVLKNSSQSKTVEEIAAQTQGDPEVVFKILEHWTQNPERKLARQPSNSPLSAKYSLIK